MWQKYDKKLSDIDRIYHEKERSLEHEKHTNKVSKEQQREELSIKMLKFAE